MYVYIKKNIHYIFFWWLVIIHISTIRIINGFFFAPKRKKFKLDSFLSQRAKYILPFRTVNSMKEEDRGEKCWKVPFRKCSCWKSRVWKIKRGREKERNFQKEALWITQKKIFYGGIPKKEEKKIVCWVCKVVMATKLRIPQAKSIRPSNHLVDMQCMWSNAFILNMFVLWYPHISMV